MEKLALSPQEFSAATGISLTATYQALREGRIPSRRLGRRVLISVDELRLWLAGNCDLSDTTTIAHNDVHLVEAKR
jgi:excisionase family DNA binding protein